MVIAKYDAVNDGVELFLTQATISGIYTTTLTNAIIVDRYTYIS